MFRFTVIVVALCAALAGSPALAHDFTAGALRIGHPWSRATPKGAAVGGGYLTITNTGTASDRLLGGATDVASRFEIHSMTMENGVMKMRPVKGGLEIKPGQTVELKPGGYHIMLVGLTHPLVKGQHVDATLRFEKAGTVKVYFDVQGIGAGAPSSPQPGGMHDMPMSH
jgi:copper(I)-binding protein